MYYQWEEGIKMKTKIEVEVENSETLRGTCGWLAKVEKKLSIGSYKSGSRGVWLKLGKGEDEVSILMAIDWQEEPEITCLTANGADCSEIFNTGGILFTHNAFKALLGLAKESKEILQNLDEDEELTLSIVGKKKMD